MAWSANLWFWKCQDKILLINYVWLLVKSQGLPSRRTLEQHEHRRRIGNRINLELFRSLFVFGIRVRGRGRFCRSSSFFFHWPVVSERSEFRRSVKESLNGPVQANRSDGTKPGIGIERKNKPTFSVNMYIKSGYFKSNFPISFLTMMQEIRLICL